jgi:hypothetical protein
MSDPIKKIEEMTRKALVRREAKEEVFRCLPEYRQALALEAIAHLLSIIAANLTKDDPNAYPAIRGIMAQLTGTDR